MPKANRVWTIKDVNGAGEGPEQNADDGGSSTALTAPAAIASTTSNPWSSQPPSDSSKNPTPSTIKCCHLPNLSRALQARDMLERILHEFEPIIRRRNYNVRSVSEFCCCGDGLDYEPGCRRKRPKQPSNLLGYNYTSTSSYTGKSHTIHIRLRHEANHAMFKLYEDVAGTMAHELAHCEIAPHNDKFNKLMDEIIDEHASLMASRLTRNGLPMLAFGTTGQVLGGDRSAVLSLADARKKQQAQNNAAGRVLGGDVSFIQWMTPREAAVAAADARRRQAQMRLRGDMCCRPCLDSVADDDDVVVVEEDKARQVDTARHEKKKRPSNSTVLEDMENRKPRAKTRPAADLSKGSDGGGSVKAVDIIDLTSNDEDDDDDNLSSKRVTAASSFDAIPHVPDAWSCVRCTFRNQQETALCALCYTDRDWRPL